MATLPPEQILDLLSRLPVKSLCRFRCVSKSWLNLINDPRFVKMHLRITQRQRLLIASKFLYTVDLETITYDDDKVVAVEIDAPGWKSINIDSPLWTPNHYHRQSPKWIKVIGSCNGLLCIEMFRDLLIYNPSTKEFKHIPYFHSINARKLHGFGYVESIDDYKYVKMDYCEKNVHVYSLRNDSWTSINRLDLDFNIYTEGIVTNGAIHWVAENPHQGQSMILAFDLVEEKFETLPPPDIMIDNNCSYSLGLLRGCLCLSTERHIYDPQFWVMKEYGVKGSWTRIRIPDKVFCLKPLCYLNSSSDDTMLLFMNMHQLVLCDTKEKKLKNIEADGIPDHESKDCDDADWLDIDMYVESLVSPYFKTQV